MVAAGVVLALKINAIIQLVTLAIQIAQAIATAVVTFGALRGYTRGSTAEKVGPTDWIYRDSKTNQPFDFDYPFPSLASPPA